MDHPSTTVVVVPREVHSAWIEMLDVLHTNTDAPYCLVVVDGGSPASVRRKLERLAVERDFTLVRSDALLSGNEARNLALRHVRTEFTAMLDNDTIVPPGWLPALERCAAETGAMLVSPTVLLGDTDEWEIHFAGGTCRIVGDHGSRRYEEINTLIHRPLSDLEGLERAPTEYLELHCILVRTALFDQIGPFDEELIGARDHADLALKATAVGAGPWLEPAVVVRYQWPKRLRPTDLPFYFPRWSDEWTQRSFARFNTEWQLTDTSIDDTFVRGHLERRLGSPPRPEDPRRARLWRATRRARRALDMVGTPIAVRVADRRRARCGPARVVHFASWDSE